MGLQDSDLILVERSNVLKKVTYGNRANIDSSDLLLVERTDGSSGTTGKYKCTYSNFSSANSTDLILVEADSTTNGRVVGQKYKETKSAWDFSTSSNADIHSANYAVPSSKLTFTYGNTGNDTTGFSVFEVQVEVTDSGSSSTGHLYIGVRNTATYYHGDLPIGAVQILQSNGTSFRTNDHHNGDWNFAFGDESTGATSTDPPRGYYEWSSTDSTKGEEELITDETLSPAGFEFFSMEESTSSNKRRFSYTEDGTPSSSVGAKQGVNKSSYPADMSTILPVGTENISQDSTTSNGGYLYNETSGGNNSPKKIVWLNAPEATDGTSILTIHNGDRIRICYYGGANGSSSSSGLQTSNCIYLRWVEES